MTPSWDCSANANERECNLRLNNQHKQKVFTKLPPKFKNTCERVFLRRQKNMQPELYQYTLLTDSLWAHLGDANQHIPSAADGEIAPTQ